MMFFNLLTHVFFFKDFSIYFSEAFFKYRIIVVIEMYQNVKFIFIFYLQSQDKTTGGVNPEPCPICARQLGKQVKTLVSAFCFQNIFS